MEESTLEPSRGLYKPEVKRRVMYRSKDMDSSGQGNLMNNIDTRGVNDIWQKLLGGGEVGIPYMGKNNEVGKEEHTEVPKEEGEVLDIKNALRRWTGGSLSFKRSQGDQWFHDKRIPIRLWMSRSQMLKDYQRYLQSYYGKRSEGKRSFLGLGMSKGQMLKDYQRYLKTFYKKRSDPKRSFVGLGMSKGQMLKNYQRFLQAQLSGEGRGGLNDHIMRVGGL